MSVLQAEVFEAFRDLGATDDKALKAAAVLGKSVDEIAALRADVNTEISNLRTDMNKGFFKVDVDIVGIKGELVMMRWMVGVNLTLTLLGFGSVLGFLCRLVT